MLGGGQRQQPTATSNTGGMDMGAIIGQLIGSQAQQQQNQLSSKERNQGTRRLTLGGQVEGSPFAKPEGLDAFYAMNPQLGRPGSGTYDWNQHVNPGYGGATISAPTPPPLMHDGNNVIGAYGTGSTGGFSQMGPDGKPTGTMPLGGGVEGIMSLILPAMRAAQAGRPAKGPNIAGKPQSSDMWRAFLPPTAQVYR